MKLNGVDLNLLPMLNALLEEQHVSRAAKAAGLSQPAMSNALRRLRALLEDDLLIRGGGGMILTPKAMRLKDPVRRAMANLEQILFHDQEFDPATWSQIIRLGFIDYSELVVAPDLARELTLLAPKIRFSGQMLDNRYTYERFESGDLDMAIGYFPACPPSFYRKTLFRETFTCLVRRGHPIVGDGPLTMETYLALSHVLISPGGDMVGTVDEVLAKLDLTRNIQFSVGHFTAAPRVVAETDFITTIPKRIAKRHADSPDLCVVEPPLELDGFDVTLLWHERTYDDAAFRWLRELLVRIGKQL